jgi:hypothetical protein
MNMETAGLRGGQGGALAPILLTAQQNGGGNGARLTAVARASAAARVDVEGSREMRAEPRATGAHAGAGAPVRGPRAPTRPPHPIAALEVRLAASWRTLSGDRSRAASGVSFCRRDGPRQRALRAGVTPPPPDRDERGAAASCDVCVA